MKNISDVQNKNQKKEVGRAEEGGGVYKRENKKMASAYEMAL